MRAKLCIPMVCVCVCARVCAFAYNAGHAGSASVVEG